MASNLKKTDVVIIGFGGMGGLVALPLTRAGLDVVGLDAGGWLSPRDYAPDEIRYRTWPNGKANDEVPTHRSHASAPQSPRPARHTMMNAIGGTTIHYYGQAWRLNPWDFKVVRETTRRYGANRIPKGSTVEDWPFGYEELEPFYDTVEREVGVSGNAGNINGTIDPRGSIFEGPRTRGYPMPALRTTSFTEMMADSGRKLGWHPFPSPATIASQAYQGRAGCVYHGYCSGGGCHVNAKGSTAVTTIPKALETKRLTVVTHAIVTAIEVDRNGRATGVTYVKGGQEYFQPADVVLLAAHLYESTRLLLLSKSKAYPRGLSNNHGQVGRHYFTHNTSWGVSALFPWNLNRWYGTPAQTMDVDDWADDNFDHSGLDFIGGGNLSVRTERRPIQAATMSTWGRAPKWGSAWKTFIKENADRTAGSYLQKTTLPYEDNYLDLDPVVKDPRGVPVIRITGEYKDNDRKLGAFVQEKMVQWFMAAGAIATEKSGQGLMYMSSHSYGSTRMGDNPETNVVNRWGFSHEVPNLGILGSSVMGTSGARNPTLTAQALAWRTAEYLVKNWKTIIT